MERKLRGCFGFCGDLLERKTGSFFWWRYRWAIQTAEGTRIDILTGFIRWKLGKEIHSGVMEGLRKHQDKPVLLLACSDL